MYLFTRSVRLRLGDSRDQLDWARGLTEKLNEITPLRWLLFRSVFSPKVGELVWVTSSENLEELDAAEAKLIVDESYLSTLDLGAKFVESEAITDRLGQVVHVAGTLGQDSPAFTQTTSFTPAVIGQSDNLVGWTMRLADQLYEKTGSAVTVTFVETGPLPVILMSIVYDSAADFYRGAMVGRSDPDLLATYAGEESSRVNGYVESVIHKRLA